MKLALTISHVARCIAGLGVGAIVSTTVMIFAGKFLHWGPLQLDEGDLDLRAVMFFSALVFVFAVIIGLPGHALLCRLRLRNWYWYVGMAVIVSLACAAVMADHGESLESFSSYPLWAGLCASVAWLFRRPDKDGQSKGPLPETHF